MPTETGSTNTGPTVSRWVLLLDVARFEHWPGLALLHAAGFQTWAMIPSPDAAEIWELLVPERLALVLGAEGPGLADQTIASASKQVRILISPYIDSINVGHAAAIAFAVTRRG